MEEYYTMKNQLLIDVKKNDRKSILKMIDLLYDENNDKSKNEIYVLLNTLSLLDRNITNICMMNQDLFEVLSFWFGTIKFDKPITQQQIFEQWINVWFAKEQKQKEIDEIMNKSFKHLFEKNIYNSNFYEDMALVVLYDQISRNVFRGTANAYHYDCKSLYIVNKYVKSIDYVLSLNVQYIIIIVIALTHSENIDDQNLCLNIIEELFIKYKDQYMQIITLLKKISENHMFRIKHFGRIPERNKFLNRQTTNEEQTFMDCI